MGVLHFTHSSTGPVTSDPVTVLTARNELHRRSSCRCGARCAPYGGLPRCHPLIRSLRAKLSPYGFQRHSLHGARVLCAVVYGVPVLCALPDGTLHETDAGTLGPRSRKGGRSIDQHQHHSHENRRPRERDYLDWRRDSENYGCAEESGLTSHEWFRPRVRPVREPRLSLLRPLLDL